MSISNIDLYKNQLNSPKIIELEIVELPVCIKNTKNKISSSLSFNKNNELNDKVELLNNKSKSKSMPIVKIK